MVIPVTQTAKTGKLPFRVAVSFWPFDVSLTSSCSMLAPFGNLSSLDTSAGFFPTLSASSSFSWSTFALDVSILLGSSLPFSELLSVCSFGESTNFVGWFVAFWINRVLSTIAIRCSRFCGVICNGTINFTVNVFSMYFLV